MAIVSIYIVIPTHCTYAYENMYAALIHGNGPGPTTFELCERRPAFSTEGTELKPKWPPRSSVMPT
ncbi:hypothetical protein CTA1_6677 [Colletotrichum tanaceti]|uniref:Uncharacterized protein n=1 Tax=Colletotrichum tanaceti TaxID=1306861 RepID=A0A4U6X264_9PEZI|nr:hypothetical protein CTA1_6677 [Colletotrichum tanaceti]